MAKLRAIFTVLVILACVSICECRTEDIQCDIKCQLCENVLKKQADIEFKKIIEITENVCNLKEAEPLEEQESEGQCNREWKTVERTCQEVSKHLSLYKSTHSFVNYLCTACPVPEQVTKISYEYLVNYPVPKQDGRALKLLATASRLDIEDFLQKKVFLEVEVKVKENWRQDEGLLKNYGYGGQIQAL